MDDEFITEHWRTRVSYLNEAALHRRAHEVKGLRSGDAGGGRRRHPTAEQRHRSGGTNEQALPRDGQHAIRACARGSGAGGALPWNVIRRSSKDRGLPYMRDDHLGLGHTRSPQILRYSSRVSTVRATLAMGVTRSPSTALARSRPRSVPRLTAAPTRPGIVTTLVSCFRSSW